MTKTITIRTGSARLPFEENYQIAKANMLAGRPFDEWFLPAVHVPDPNGLPEWWTITTP